MAVESATDRAAFFSTDDFGVAATYTPSGGSASTVNGLLEDDFFAALSGTSEVPIESAKLTFTCREADVSSPRHGDAVVINSVSYTVVGVQPDGAGMLILILQTT
jgi:hypothetical protein